MRYAPRGPLNVNGDGYRGKSKGSPVQLHESEIQAPKGEIDEKCNTLTLGSWAASGKSIPSLVSRWMVPIAVNNMASAILAGKRGGPSRKAGQKNARPRLEWLTSYSRPVAAGTYRLSKIRD